MRRRTSWSLWLLAASLVAVAPAAAATAVCGSGTIPNIRGEARVTPSTPVGTLLGRMVTTSGFVRNSCEYDVGSEDEAAEWNDEKGITMVLRPNERFSKVESGVGYVLSLPDITDRIGVGLKLVSANGVTLTGSEEDIVLGHASKEAGLVLYAFDGSNVSVFPANTMLSYQAVKVKPSTESGVFYLSNYTDIFNVDWYVDYYDSAKKRLILTTPISMTLGVGASPLKINVSGCSLGSLRETLPKTPRSSFSGVGSTSEAMKSFNLQVTCQGTTLVKLSINANNPFTSGVGVGQPAATTGEATAGSGGMGIQLLSGASGETPWNFDNAMTLNEANVGASGNTAFAIPLRARYYQTATTVRPGRLTVGFTVTFTYE
ncbi:fimbrial protein [Bordetella trematum]|uniref:fimbrial protein n=1 Tax=Bordetella trematum TaxID=123899 RepID=UPI003989430A